MTPPYTTWFTARPHPAVHGLPEGRYRTFCDRYVQRPRWRRQSSPITCPRCLRALERLKPRTPRPPLWVVGQDVRYRPQVRDPQVLRSREADGCVRGRVTHVENDGRLKLVLWLRRGRVTYVVAHRRHVRKEGK
jgi:hypothetical protein